ncbi:MAG: TrkH family potassium uptake protein [Bacteroidaceae bacterium]|nr:TrkH family potassium uptake protein [Bacteroidaceae bacterium]
MIHPKIISRIIGLLLLIETFFLSGAFAMSLYYNEGISMAYVYTLLATMACASVLLYFGRGKDRNISRKDGYIVVSTSWIVFSVFGSMPFIFSNAIPSVTNAFFETMSGFTTTGATILDNIEALPPSLLFWRAMTHWMGGLGIVFFTVAVLPIFGMGDIHLFAAEATGPIHGKLHPRISVTARWILTIYISLTIIGAFALYLGGMNVFDSVCHSMSTMSTGGFSTKQASIAAYNSSTIEYITILFMFLGGTNFSLLYLSIFKGRFSDLFRDSEFKCYVNIVLIATVGITVGLLMTTSIGVEKAFRDSLFQTLSTVTTTGYCSSDYMLWHPLLWLVISALMYTGACSGSTSGGMKCVRVAILGRVMINEFKRIVHPNAIIPVRMSRKIITSPVQSAILAYTVLYVGVVMVGVFVNMAFGLEFMEAYGLSVSCTSNVGPALGDFGPAFSMDALPMALKWFASFQMLVGRLEFFAVLLMLTPMFWRRQ